MEEKKDVLSYKYAPVKPATTRIANSDLGASEQIDKISAALAAAQGAMEGAEKAGFNPHFKAKYADLASVWGACRAPLASNGLSVVQMPQSRGSEVKLTTILSHSSGQWFKSSISAVSAKNTPQGIGSVITYLRRYALSSMVGVSAEDDDGNEASQPQQKQPPTKPPIAHLQDAIEATKGVWALPDVQRYYKDKYNADWPPTDINHWRKLVAVVKSGVDPREVK